MTTADGVILAVVIFLCSVCLVLTGFVLKMYTEILTGRRERRDK